MAGDTLSCDHITMQWTVKFPTFAALFVKNSRTVTAIHTQYKTAAVLTNGRWKQEVTGESAAEHDYPDVSCTDE